MITIQDHLDRSLHFKKRPIRIVSLVPSLSELVADLYGANNLVGVTKFCIHPPSVKVNAEIVGGTKTVNIEKVKALQPDIIIANKEENDQSQIEDLCQTEKVFVSDIQSFRSSIKTITSFGELFNTQSKAKEIVDCIKKNVPQNVFTKQKVLYLIWKSPWMSIGIDTYIHSILIELGLQNVIGNTMRYPQLTECEIKKLNPNIIMLSSEPFPFKEKHLSILKGLFPNSKVILVDGEAFSWYGSRITHLPNYFNQLHKDITR